MRPDIPFGDNSKTVIAQSRTEALRLGCDYIASDHLLLGVLRSESGRGREIIALRIDDPEKLVEAITAKYEIRDVENIGNVPLTSEAENVIKGLAEECRTLNATEIGSEHILLSMLHNDETAACRMLNRFNITYDDVLNQLR
jgi:ATP-dependent Clp protease ATP-binding subunit ClpC